MKNDKIDKLDSAMAEIDRIWEERGSTDATSEPEWEEYESMLMLRCELMLVRCNG